MTGSGLTRRAAVLRVVQGYLSQNPPSLDAGALRDARGTAGLVAFVPRPLRRHGSTGVSCGCGFDPRHRQPARAGSAGTGRGHRDDSERHRRRWATTTRALVRIALLGPVAWRTPPHAYGPWERVTGLLAEGLVQRGLDVTLFATLDSVTSARLDGVCPRGYAEDATMDGRVWEALHVSHALARTAGFDLVHNHLDWLPLAFATHWRAPLLTTVHGFSGAGIVPAYTRAAGSSFVSISDSDRHSAIDYAATVHHGVDVDELPFGDGPGPQRRLVVLGRIHPDKGVHTAIETARRAGLPLTICGIVQDERYFAERVAPHIDGDRVVFLGPVGPERRAEVLGTATALLHLIDFDEPFGLSVVESMICGTPVVAFGRGSMPEVVDEGVTGLLVHTVEQAVVAVERVAAIDRAGCRARATDRFAAGRMIDDYLAVYEKLIHA